MGTLNASAANQAGNVVLIAFGGSTAGSGVVTFNSINASGGTGSLGQDGNVYIFAGATSGTTAIGPTSVGSATITATGSNFGQGIVQLAVTTPSFIGVTLASTGQVESPYIADYIESSVINSPGIANISITASCGITLNAGNFTGMNSVISPQYNYGVFSPAGIFLNNSVIPNPGNNLPAWTGPVNYTGSMNAGNYQITVWDPTGQNVSLSGGTFVAGQGIQVLATPNSSFNTGITYTGPVSNYGAWVNGTQVESGISVASGQMQTVSFASNTGAATSGYNVGPNGVTLMTINTGATSSSFGPGVTGFTFGAPSSSVTLSSLDLSNPTVVSDIGALIAANTVGISGQCHQFDNKSINSITINSNVKCIDGDVCADRRQNNIHRSREW